MSQLSCAATTLRGARRRVGAWRRAPLLGGLLGLALSLSLATSCGERRPPADSAAEAEAAARVHTERLFRSSCITCHAAGAAGAARPGDPRWRELLEEKGMAALVANVREGYNAMPSYGRLPRLRRRRFEPFDRLYDGMEEMKLGCRRVWSRLAATLCCALPLAVASTVAAQGGGCRRWPRQGRLLRRLPPSRRQQPERRFPQTGGPKREVPVAAAARHSERSRSGAGHGGASWTAWSIKI